MISKNDAIKPAKAVVISLKEEEAHPHHEGGHTMKYLNFSEAVRDVESLIGSEFQDHEVTIAFWDLSVYGVGVRVAEVSLLRHEGGNTFWTSWLDSDPKTLGVCAAAERAVLARMTCTGFDDSEQAMEIADADWRLIHLMKEGTP